MRRSCTTCRTKVETAVQGIVSINLQDKEVYFCSYRCIIIFDEKMVKAGKNDGLVYAIISRSKLFKT